MRRLLGVDAEGIAFTAASGEDMGLFFCLALGSGGTSGVTSFVFF
jgi:hypothetical protein